MLTESGAVEQRALRNAERGALKIRNVLNATGRPVVTPVLVVWGPGAVELPAIEIVGRVPVCAGGQSTQWLSYLQRLEPVLADERRDQMVHAIEEHVTWTEAAFGRDDHRCVRSKTKSIG